jgi:hypothetical protein
MTVHYGLEKMRGKIISHNISAIGKMLREISVGLQDLRFPVQGMFMSLCPWVMTLCILLTEYQ